MSMSAEDLIRRRDEMVAGTEEEERSPIGVPGDYAAFLPAATQMGSADASERWPQKLAPVPPRYFDGDQYRYASRPPEQIAQAQNRLEQVGLLEGSYRKGMWDPPTVTAYRNLLEYANASGFTEDQALASFDRFRPEEPVRAPLVKRETNPDDLRRIFRRVSREVMGSGTFANPVLDEMVASFQAQQSREQEQAYAVAETGGTVTESSADPEGFAEDYLAKYDPLRHDARKVVAAFEVISQMLAGNR